MTYTITGKLSLISNTQQVTDKFAKREFVVSVLDGQYEQLISLQFSQDKCTLLDSYKIGQEVTVSFNLKGRKWTDKQGNDKYFNTLEAWRIEGAAGTPVKEAVAQAKDGGDGLPF